MKFNLKNLKTASIMIIALMTSCIVGCGKTASIEPSQTKSQPDSYLSITLSDEEAGQLKTNFYTYDIQSQKLNGVAQIPITAQYPLGVVDEKLHTVFCTERDARGDDQLVEIDLKTGKVKWLTNNIFAINYMIPVNNEIVMVAQLRGQQQIGLCSFNLSSGSLNVWDKNNPDIFAQSLTFNPFTNKLYATVYSWRERIHISGKASEELSSVVLPPVNDIIEYTADGTKVKQLFSVQEQIGTFVVSSQSDKAILRSAPSVFATKDLYLINLQTGNRTVLSIPGYSPTGDVFFSTDNNGIYFAGFNVKTQVNGIYYYDFASKKVRTIFARPNSFLNNFALYKK